eukprot:COSAG02_NODE_819_length_16803_cov_6.292924_11_plen_40_part_00
MCSGLDHQWQIIQLRAHEHGDTEVVAADVSQRFMCVKEC